MDCIYKRGFPVLLTTQSTSQFELHSPISTCFHFISPTIDTLVCKEDMDSILLNDTSECRLEETGIEPRSRCWGPSYSPRLSVYEYYERLIGPAENKVLRRTELVEGWHKLINIVNVHLQILDCVFKGLFQLKCYSSEVQRTPVEGSEFSLVAEPA